MTAKTHTLRRNDDTIHVQLQLIMSHHLICQGLTSDTMQGGGVIYT